MQAEQPGARRHSLRILVSGGEVVAPATVQGTGEAIGVSGDRGVNSAEPCLGVRRDVA
jgi:hypothetical protein